jgi:hypothetical protein
MINIVMNEHFIKFKETYNTDFFAAIYENSPLEDLGSFRSVIEDANIVLFEEINVLFDKFNMEPNVRNCSLSKVTRPVAPHTNPGNNGLIIFPISGQLEVSFYSYDAPIVNGVTLLSPYPKDRVQMSPEETAKLNSSKFETFVIDEPIAINGRRIFSYKPAGGTQPLIFLLKIPFSMNWESIKTILEKLYD